MVELAAMERITENLKCEMNLESKETILQRINVAKDIDHREANHYKRFSDVLTPCRVLFIVCR